LFDGSDIPQIRNELPNHRTLEHSNAFSEDLAMTHRERVVTRLKRQHLTMFEAAWEFG
jgi:DNA-binding CsgD family transcriptional regulator